MEKRLLVSIICPCHNVGIYLEQSLRSLLDCTYRPLEIILFNDCSIDNTKEILLQWIQLHNNHDSLTIIYCENTDPSLSSCAFARNSAILKSSGELIAHLDADDYMNPLRIEKQVELYMSKENKDCIIGCNFNRIPVDSTPYYTNWLNSLHDDDLYKHQYRECTIIAPTWLYPKSVFEKIALVREKRNPSSNTTLTHTTRAFAETYPGMTTIPEDLIFFLDHLESGGSIYKVNDQLLTYRYTINSTSSQISNVDLQCVRIEYLQRMILSQNKWKEFTIWGAGKDGKKFLSLLQNEFAKQVVAFCDVDDKKIGRMYYCQRNKRHIPIINYLMAKSPIIICVASKRTSGELEKNISKLQIIEGIDYFHFM
jgi:ribonuclease P protein subunit RPP14